MRRRRRSREERKQETDFKEAVCCPFAAVEKMKRNARGNWDPREVQQPFRPNPNGVGDRTTTLRRLLIGAVKLVVGGEGHRKRWEDCKRED